MGKDTTCGSSQTIPNTKIRVKRAKLKITRNSWKEQKLFLLRVLFGDLHWESMLKRQCPVRKPWECCNSDRSTAYRRFACRATGWVCTIRSADKKRYECCRDKSNHWKMDQWWTCKTWKVLIAEFVVIRRAAIGQKISLDGYTYEHFLDGLLKGWKAFLIGGMRGFHFPHPFVMTKPWCIPLGNTPPHDCGI